jgi:hypothetical protein
MKQKKVPKQHESRLKFLIAQSGEFESIRPDGKLDDGLILDYLLQINPQAAKDYFEIVGAYNKLKKEDDFIKGMHKRQVSEKTLKNLVFFHDVLVKPIKPTEKFGRLSIYVGEVLKLPSSTSQYDEGESWKSLIKKDKDFNVGDKVMYSYKSNIILDNVLLHLVSGFAGKILK